jgi:hypothetical protein
MLKFQGIYINIYLFIYLFTAYLMMCTISSYVALNGLMISELETVWQAAARVLTEVTPRPLPGSRPNIHPLGTEDCRCSSYYQVYC